MLKKTLSLLAVLVATGCGDKAGGAGPDAAPLADADTRPDAASLVDARPKPDGGVTTDCPVPSGAGTMHTGNITADTTWTAAASPHIVTTDVVIRGATLTIEACATVLVKAGHSFTVGNTAGGPAAAMVAHGAVMQSGDDVNVRPVKFGEADAGMHWGMIRIFETGRLDFEIVILQGGGEQSTQQNGGGVIVAVGPNVAPLSPIVRVKGVLIDGSGGFGVNLQSFAGFTDDSDDLEIQNAGQQTPAGALDTSYPVYITVPAVHTLPAGVYTGNAKDAIMVFQGSTTNQDETFHDRGVPYFMHSNLAFAPTTTVAQGGLTTLTIEAGVTMRFEKFNANFASINLGVSGGGLPTDIRATRLVAQGTSDHPILLTSAQASPAAGDWAGIKWAGGPATGNVMSYTTVRYAGGFSGTVGFGCGPNADDAAVIIWNWRPDDAFITNSSFLDSAGAGIVQGWRSDMTGPMLKGTNNTFTNIGNGCQVSLNNAANGGCPGSPPVCY